MALRNQPYFPLYVQDYLTDEKLNMCSAAAQGVYIKILCIFHKSETYGGILLKQKDKQKNNTCINFADKLSKLLPFDTETIHEALVELIEEKVLIIEEDFLYQKRMVRDFDISNKRSISGKKGGDKTKNLLKQKSKQNTEYEYEYENEYDNRFILNINELENFLKNEQIWLEQTVCMRQHITPERAGELIHEFVETLKDRGEEKREPTDVKEHFINWLKKRKEKENDTAQKDRNANTKEYRARLLMQEYEAIIGKPAQI